MEDQILHERECYITSAASGRSVFTWEGVLHYFSCKWKINFDMRGSVTLLQLLLQVEDQLSDRRDLKRQIQRERGFWRHSCLTSVRHLKEKGRKLRAGIKKEGENCDKTFNEQLHIMEHVSFDFVKRMTYFALYFSPCRILSALLKIIFIIKILF